ncbi:Uncharacterized protein TCM_041562 [Theobroma cacao]|uniref:Uncharacterized protein n=1 Tax=Theobroma cacao TaxID=3641 RepID=A0A061GWZ0_THECC|nr:Uncharacterized protein TCM_041562 [Theobroma cacao]
MRNFLSKTQHARGRIVPICKGIGSKCSKRIDKDKTVPGTPEYRNLALTLGLIYGANGIVWQEYASFLALSSIRREGQPRQTALKNENSFSSKSFQSSLCSLSICYDMCVVT